MNGPLVVFGDALLDVDLCGQADRLCPDAPVPVVRDVVERPRPGGAALAALLAASGAAGGREVVLVTPLAADQAAERLAALLAGWVRVLPLPWAGATPCKTRLRVSGQSVARIDSGGPAVQVGALPPRLADAVAAAVAGAGSILVCDYGYGATALPGFADLLGRRGRVPLVWDPHPRGVAPVAGAELAVPNATEAALFAPDVAGSGPSATGPSATGLAAAQARAEELVRRWGVRAVAVTLGAGGVLLSHGTGTPLVVPVARPVRGDTCGAGDQLAAATALALADGALPSEALVAGVDAAAEFLAAGGVGALLDRPAAGATTAEPVVDERLAAEQLPAEVGRLRARSATLVATGGCFDLLHAGHVATLHAARALGDALVVLLNSDDSVRRLKGPDRPLCPAADRRRVLEALDCVDAVVEFDEPTPERALAQLRPQVWAKGGDYTGAELPEAALVRSWGGQVVALPYLAGRSTTGLVQRARAARV
jgi:D-beta-D-heptose 7-phosphate kinase/D-beta-D-heptose 1-phosphate adenosyltransferase